MNHCRVLLLLLSLVHSVSAMQIHPANAKPKKNCCVRLCAWVCSWKCCKTQEQRDREQNQKEIERIMRQAKLDARRAARDSGRKVLLAHTKSVDLRRATGGAISPAAIKQIKVESAAYRVEDLTQRIATAAVCVTPTPMLPGLSSLSIEQLTARASTPLTTPSFQQQVSPTPPALSQATTTLSVEDV